MFVVFVAYRMRNKNKKQFSKKRESAGNTIVRDEDYMDRKTNSFEKDNPLYEHRYQPLNLVISEENSYLTKRKPTPLWDKYTNGEPTPLWDEYTNRKTGEHELSAVYY